MGTEVISEDISERQLENVAVIANLNGIYQNIGKVLKMAEVAMKNIAYRKATVEECYSIAVLKGIVWNTTYKGIYSDEALTGYDVKKNEQILQSIVNNPEIEIYVATDDDKIVGFMTCGKPYRPFRHYEQEIGLLYILKEYQKQGIGKGFFEIARKQVREAGYKEFIVAVNRQNENAIHFYLAMGGKIVCSEEKQLRIEFAL